MARAVQKLDLARRYALPAIERSPERWKLVYTVPGSEMQIFQRVPPTNIDGAAAWRDVK